MLMLFGYDLSVIALIGIIMLIGIVKKNGIMIVDFALTAQREQNLSPEDAIYRACVLRFRPIMMTTMCAIFGGVPLKVGGGTGAELRQPLGFAIVGGLAGQPGPDAVHDTGRLSLSRPGEQLARASTGIGQNWPPRRRGRRNEPIVTALGGIDMQSFSGRNQAGRASCPPAGETPAPLEQPVGSQDGMEQNILSPSRNVISLGLCSGRESRL